LKTLGKQSFGAERLRTVLTTLGAIGALMMISTGSARADQCPNEAMRAGKSKKLPDCRAYELVSPANSNGRSVSVLEFGLSINQFPSELASPSGEQFAYFIQGGPLPEPGGATGTYDRYGAERFPDGWRTLRRLSPTGEEAVFPNGGGIAPDHRYYFVGVNVGVNGSGGALSDDGEANYLGDSSNSFELIGLGSIGTERRAEGRWITEGGTHVVFSTGGSACEASGEPCEVNQLEPNAPPTGTAAVYDRSADGATEVVSLLPNDLPPAAGEGAFYQGASADGSVIAFNIGSKLYVRIGGQETREVFSGSFTFAGLSRNGDELFFESEGNGYVYDTQTGLGHRFTNTDPAAPMSFVNVSADGSNVYFISEAEIGGEGTSGQSNLFVWDRDDDSTTFVATVSPGDVSGLPGLGNWTTAVVAPDVGANDGPGANSSRTTPDGNVLVFESSAQLLPAYDNAGHVEIYRYDATADQLGCVSCRPDGLPPTRNARLEAIKAEQISTHAVVRNVTVDGLRVFFETPEPLAAGDTDERNDIYEWNALGAGGLPQLALISSGANRTLAFAFEVETNILAGVTPLGDDVFFVSWEHLVPEAADGAPAVYNARVGGGFPSALGSACEGEACQALPGQAPGLAEPGSNVVKGKGNVKAKHRCRRAKRRSHRHRRRSCRGHKRAQQLSPNRERSAR
jgi:hypothetical protein